jgi:outer membrane lipoprotein-sorting protein
VPRITLAHAARGFRRCARRQVVVHTFASAAEAQPVGRQLVLSPHRRTATSGPIRLSAEPHRAGPHDDPHRLPPPTNDRSSAASRKVYNSARKRTSAFPQRRACANTGRMQPFGKYFSAFASASLLVCASGTAAAYVPPAWSILEDSAARRSHMAFKTLVAEGQRTAESEVPEKIWDAILIGTGRRLERKTDKETVVQLTRGDRSWTYRPGETPQQDAPTAVDLLLQMSLSQSVDPGGARGLKFLASYGIDRTVVSLTWEDERVAYVIGAKPWEPTKPQLWVDKELMVPIRWILVDAQSGVVTDIQLRGFGSPITSEWYPREIRVLQDGKQIAKTVYDKVQLNQPLDSGLFQPPPAAS